MQVLNLNALRIVSIFCVATLPVAVIDGDAPGALVLALAGAAAWLPGLVSNPASADAADRTMMAQVAVSWMQVAFAAAGVTLLLARFTMSDTNLSDPVSALYEATSGVSTTGLTMAEDPARLSPTMQWWRSILQWGGAAGVITFGLAVAERSGDRDAELGSEWNEKPSQNNRRSVWIILGLMTGLTVIGFLGLWALGDGAWVAANHAMTATATGGFSVDGDSAGGSPPLARSLLALLCFVSAISYATLWGAVRSEGPPIWKRTQLRTSLVLIHRRGGRVHGGRGEDGPDRLDRQGIAAAAAPGGRGVRPPVPLGR